MTITAMDNGNVCTQVITWHSYTGQLTGVAPGSYDFRVNHVTGGGRSATAWTGMVTVQ